MILYHNLPEQMDNASVYWPAESQSRLSDRVRNTRSDFQSTMLVMVLCWGGIAPASSLQSKELREAPSRSCYFVKAGFRALLAREAMKRKKGERRRGASLRCKWCRTEMQIPPQDLHLSEIVLHISYNQGLHINGSKDVLSSSSLTPLQPPCSLSLLSSAILSSGQCSLHIYCCRH